MTLQRLFIANSTGTATIMNGKLKEIGIQLMSKASRSLEVDDRNRLPVDDDGVSYNRINHPSSSHDDAKMCRFRSFMYPRHGRLLLYNTYMLVAVAARRL